MKIIARRTLDLLLNETRGAEIAEAAAVLPLMFMVMLGLFWFGQAFSIYGAITRAAQEGVRASSVPYCVTCNTTNTPPQNASAAVQNALVGSKLNPVFVRFPIPAPSLQACSPTGGSGGSVPCSAVGSLNICYQGNVQITNSLGATGMCGNSVSFQYPFKFWLPFTSIDNQTIWITASARARLENR